MNQKPELLFTNLPIFGIEKISKPRMKQTDSGMNDPNAKDSFWRVSKILANEFGQPIRCKTLWTIETGKRGP